MLESTLAVAYRDLSLRDVIQVLLPDPLEADADPVQLLVYVSVVHRSGNFLLGVLLREEDALEIPFRHVSDLS